MLFGGINLIKYLIDSNSTKNTNKELQAMRAAVTPTPTAEVSVAEAVSATPTPAPVSSAPDAFQTISDTILPELQELYKKNNDLVGWIRIPNGGVDLPVLYRDNDYYLNHDFYGKEIKSGSIFLDEYHPFSSDTQHLVLHGHNMYDGSMFGHLNRYERVSHLRGHGIVYFSSLYKEEAYVAYAVLIVPGSAADPDFFPYTGNPTFYSEDQFNQFIQEVKDRSLFNINIDVQPTDALLTLSTCLEEDRIVLFCRRQRPDESLESLQFTLSQTMSK